MISQAPFMRIGGVLFTVSLALFTFGFANPSVGQFILETHYNNPNYPPADAFAQSGGTLKSDWAKDVCGGEWLLDDLPRYEWMPVLNQGVEVSHDNKIDETIVGASGTALVPPALVRKYPISQEDMPFTHPFGFDFEFFVAPDTEYTALLAPNNYGPKPPDRHFADGFRYATQDRGLSVPGVLGVETDQGLVPLDYRVNDGDRVAVFGRWIVDCGHSDFHSEIHPPLLLATARPVSSDATHSTVIGRPYLVSQEFAHGGLRRHLVTELEKLLGFPGACPRPFIPCSTQIEARPIINSPFEGIKSMTYYVRPPSPSPSQKARLLVRFHFIVRTGVVVRVSQAGSDMVGVKIVMNDLTYAQLSLPPKTEHLWTIDALLRLVELNQGKVLARLVEPSLDKVHKDLLPQASVLTDRYTLTPVLGVQDTQLITFAIGDLPARTPVNVDDSQPWPVYGRLDLQWER